MDWGFSSSAAPSLASAAGASVLRLQGSTQRRMRLSEMELLPPCPRDGMKVGSDGERRISNAILPRRTAGLLKLEGVPHDSAPRSHFQASLSGCSEATGKK